MISEWILDAEDTDCNQVLFKAVSIFWLGEVVVSCFQL